ncbi:L-fucose isomerase [Longilinea arvoryzae]|uniref:L-fucose isomerase n=1 Tax=Longilinea arvoryzae TaxID=360412 RepID=A0A0S7BHC6_9CHLR|nr:L-fucose isomerase [Longilinea arvoryzae]GAP13141.1 L-fucose isomerase [Longilinea arvoryzae]
MKAAADPKNVNQWRWVGEFPKVGIRPVIDGRRNGIREALEDQTMGMAHRVAGLISNHVRYPNGKPVECVIADTTIGGVVEAQRTDEKFARQGVGVVLTVTPSWCYGSETIVMDPLLPKAIWGFNATERPGAVYLAAALAAHNQKGLPAFSIYGRDVQEADDTEITADVQEKILRFIRAGLAAAILRGKSYLSIGGTSMGIAGSMVNPDFFETFLGMRVESVDMSEFVRRFEEKIYDPEEFQRAAAWVRKNCREGLGRNPEDRLPREKLDANWEMVIKMTLFARDLMVGNPRLDKRYLEEAAGRNAILAGFQGQRQWTDHFPNGDFMEAILNSSFDWNGIRAPYLIATENDSLNGVSMLLGNMLTHTSQIFADVRTYWSPQAVKRVTGHTLTGLAENGFIHLTNSGAAALDGCGQMEVDGHPGMKPFWEISPAEAQACLDATTWYPGQVGAFRGSGFSSGYVTRGGMPVTMLRLNLIKGLGPTLQIAEGWSVDLPESVAQTISSRTDPTWPTHWIVPRLTGRGPFKDVYSVMNNWGANHCSFAYGHVGADMITLASILRIPVCMHNVPEDQIYRPSAWGAFGTSDLEAADYRACENYGPLYGRK